MKKILIINLYKKESFIKEIYNDEEFFKINEDDLIFHAPILGGYGVIGINRLEVLSKDTSSKVGGYFAHYMKCNGYDYIQIEGKSKEPVFIYIDKDYIQIIDSKEFFYDKANITEERIKNKLNEKNIEIAEIGVAGANKIDFSRIMFRNQKSCGKNGLGKLMGEKNLKAIALKRHNNLEAKDELKLMEMNRLIAKRLENTLVETYFSDENNCYGCDINCSSTSIKKLIKKGFSYNDAKIIDDISNDYGMDSLLFSEIIGSNRNIEEYAKELIKNKQKEENKRIINNKLSKSKKEESILEKAGFCKFILNKNILSEVELESFMNKIIN